ncbi:monovalent cation/H+ antiporter complex subunit F [Streptomyces jumonjinensis]|uniref:monovalent cation/H+ antiporter complex subunit F n=1 Tax=Streptomyces jumonjinensis TaxID=1945 RepID=UPI001E2AF54A|nr:monovalent cation/H+ antiporter complex subunit F [Streptomyces jumonjinensis]
MSVARTVDQALLTAAAVMILVAGALVLVRLARGPSMLDRAMALDVCAALMIAGIGVRSAFTRDAYYFPVMLVVAFLGFTGSVGIARFIAVRDRAPDRPGADPRTAPASGPGRGPGTEPAPGTEPGPEPGPGSGPGEERR